MKLRVLMLALLPAVAPATAQRPLALVRTLENDQMFRVRAAAVEGARIVVLTGSAPFVHVFESSGYRGWGRSGRGPAELPRGRFPVTREDRESWFATAIPGEIRGQREPFSGLASEARRIVRFPASLPPVLQLKADPRGGVWVQQTTPASGQRWVYLAPGQPQTWFRLPAGETLLAVGLGEVVVLSRDADDVEVIRVYASPFPATP